jgi:hypothetical protein
MGSADDSEDAELFTESSNGPKLSLLGCPIISLPIILLHDMKFSIPESAPSQKLISRAPSAAALEIIARIALPLSVMFEETWVCVAAIFKGRSRLSRLIFFTDFKL